MSMEIYTNTLSHMIVTIIKEIYKEAGGMAGMSMSLVGNSVRNVHIGQFHANLELQENETRQNPEYTQPELNASLAMIKKIMKLDATDPFNMHIDSVALGIPDYLDVFDTYVDFATIRNNIKKGVKYMNLAYVFEKLQCLRSSMFSTVGQLLCADCAFKATCVVDHKRRLTKVILAEVPSILIAQRMEEQLTRQS